MLSKDDAQGQFPIPNPGPVAFRFQVSVLRLRLLALVIRTNASSRVGHPHPEPGEYTRSGRRAQESLDEAAFTRFRLGLVSAKPKCKVPNTGHSRFRCAVGPNPSFNRTRYGRAPWPGRRYAVHFRRPGAGVLPSAPALQEPML